MDIFYEYMAKKQKTPIDWLKLIGIIVLALFLTLAALFMLFSLPAFAGVIMVAIIGIWWGAAWFLKGLSIEYEYTITNSELDIDVIKGRTRRKHITTINLKCVDYIGSELCEATDEAMHSVGTPQKQCRFTSGKAEDTVLVTDVVSKKDNSRVRVYFSADDKLMEYIRLANPKAYKG